MESYSVLEKILQYYRQDHMKSYRILQYPRVSYKIVQDPVGLVWKIGSKSFAIVQDPTGILWNLIQFWKRSYSIMDKII